MEYGETMSKYKLCHKYTEGQYKSIRLAPNLSELFTKITSTTSNLFDLPMWVLATTTQSKKEIK